MKPGNLGKTPVLGSKGYAPDASFYPSNQPCIRRSANSTRNPLALAVAMGILGERK